MIRTITLGAATALLVVGLPVAALGFSQSLDTDTVPTVTAEQLRLEAQEQIALNEQMQIEAHEQLGAGSSDALQNQVRTRQQDQEHIETGVPEGGVPEQQQQRLQEQERVATQTQAGDQAQVQTRASDGEPQGEPIGDGDGNRYGQTGEDRGRNAGAGSPNDSEGDGECTNDGGVAGNGPHGKNG